MADAIKAIRGMHDTLPDRSPAWQHVERTVREIVTSYGYGEIRLPVLEKTALFERSIGETSDIVSKEMYTFPDRNGELLTLRPEGTAGCVRAVLENGLSRESALRLWYGGPMFRHERPQKGRLRQFHQIGLEAFGLAGPDIDAELIILCRRVWAALGLDGLRLEINSLGSAESRRRYREVLVEYFQAHRDRLDEDSLQRLGTNPLRILDSKNPDLKDLISRAPDISDSLDGESAAHFAGLRELLDAVGVEYAINPRLVRGLDYYNRTVFEWITDRLGAQGTVCAGGRYDGLVEHFGGSATPGIGFAMGLERLVSLIEDAGGGAREDTGTQVYFVVASQQAMPAAQRIAETLRDALPGLRLLLHCGGGSFKSQFKKADKSGAALALVLGEDELEHQRIGIKPLRGEGEQQEVSWADLAGELRRHLQT